MTRLREDFFKLNLGCGANILEDHWNVDLDPLHDIDEVVDVFGKLPWPDDAFDEIHAHDILEHTSWFHTERVLVEWLRVLKPGGKLSIKVPDLERICWMVVECEIDIATASALIYGWQDHGRERWRDHAHAAGFSGRLLREMVERVGLVVDELYGLEQTNLVLVATKC